MPDTGAATARLRRPLALIVATDPRCSCSLAIGLGANLGDPAATLVAVRPWLAALFPAPLRPCWSPLFRTQPVGGPPDQPDYLNAVLLVSGDGAAGVLPRGGELLTRLQALEVRFGRQRGVRWGPRQLDLDLLWCGQERSRTPELWLPHPRLQERSFVLAPLAAIDPQLVLPIDAEGDAAAAPGRPGRAATVADRLAALLPQLPEAPPLRLAPRPGWPE